jgi:hypothetical protein
MPFESFFENIDGNVRQRSGITLTLRPGQIIGTSASNEAMNTANAKGQSVYISTSATSGTTYGRYNKLTASGAGVEAIANRDYCKVTAAAANAHGNHTSLDVSSTGYVTGLGTVVRANLLVSNTVVPQGTYYGVLAEIYPAGTSSALPTASNACLGINAVAGTAMDAVVNAISFGGTDGTGCMIYTHAITMGATGAGGIRILVNGVKRWIPFVSAE